MISGHRKIHIVPVAFDIDRAVLPVLENGADKVYLLTGSPETGERQNSSYFNKIRSRLLPKVREITRIDYGFFDYANIFSKLVEIGEREKGNDVLVNLSSGGHIVTIAATLAASMYGWTPYYVIPKSYNLEMQSAKGATSGMRDWFPIQTYPISRPDEKLVRCLALLGKVETQKSLMEKLAEKGLLESAVKGKFEKKEYMRFKREFLEPLLNKDWLKRDRGGKRGRLEITDSGNEIVKIFG